jgi:hypothetical protein
LLTHDEVSVAGVSRPSIPLLLPLPLPSDLQVLSPGNALDLLVLHVLLPLLLLWCSQSDVREVTWQEGADFAKQYGCLFVETSAKQNIAVGVAFEELVLRILETPSLLGPDDDVELGAADRSGVLDLSQQQQGRGGPASSCSC